MALQVWLPLISDAHNQGLTEATFTNNGSVVFTGEGKLGTSAVFDGNNYLESTEDFGEGITTWTISCWVKPDSRDLTSGQWYRIGGIGNHIRVHLDLSSTNRFRIFVSLDGTTSTTVVLTYSTTVAEADKWYHICGTVSANKVDMYINGVLEASSAISSSYTSTLGGKVRVGSVNNGNKFSGLIQDFRIYDNALSAKEVQLLSRGLVLHYPLAPPGGENILLNGSFSKDYTNWASSGHTITTEDDYLCGHVSGALSTTRNISQSIYNAIKDDDYTTQIYTISADIKLVNYVAGTTNPYVALYFSGTYDNNGTNAWLGATRVGGTLKSNASNLPGFNNQGWVRVTYIVRFEHKPIGMTFYVYCRDCTGDLYYRNIKMEKGSVATPWCPNSADGEYTALGFNDGIEYDVSGFKNNGTKYGNLNWSSDTPRYNACYEFDGTGDYIRLKQDEYDRFRLARDELTVNIWAYKDDWSDYTSNGTSSQWNTMASCAEAGGWVIYERGNGIIHYSVATGESTYAYKWGDTAAGYAATLTGWHMFTMTYDGLAVRGYIDGELVVEVVAFTTKTPIFYKNGTASVYVGTECGASTGGSACWNGKLSDFRVYETALSSDDILELYHTGASLASNGTLMTSEYVESI